MAEVITADVFDLSRFSREDFPDQYERVAAAERYLMGACAYLDIENIGVSINPVKLYCARLEVPSVNSHGETELWVTDPRKEVYDWSKHHQTPFRSRMSVPEGAVLCIDTQDVLSFHQIKQHPYLFIGGFTVYGSVRGAWDEKRHIPGYCSRFIEIGAISYSDVGNSWTHGVFGKGFAGTARAEE